MSLFPLSDGAGRNYFDDYLGLDDGIDWRVAGDGVGDTNLPHTGLDYNPLICSPIPIPIIWGSKVYQVLLHSNSTISAIRFNQATKELRFNTRGPTGTIGYYNVTLPKNLLRGNPWRIFLNSLYIAPRATIVENQTHTSIHFSCNHNIDTAKKVGTWLMPETSLSLLLLLFLIVSNNFLLPEN